jgi:hypothetical protein
MNGINFEWLLLELIQVVKIVDMVY